MCSYAFENDRKTAAVMPRWATRPSLVGKYPVEENVENLLKSY